MQNCVYKIQTERQITGKNQIANKHTFYLPVIIRKLQKK